MKLLFLTTPCPWPATTGTRLRNAHLIRELSREHEVRTVVLEGAPVPDAQVPPGTEFLQLDRFNRPPAPAGGRWSRLGAQLRQAFGTMRPSLYAPIAWPEVAAAFRRLRPVAQWADAIWVSRSVWGWFLVRANWGRPVVVDYDEITTLSERKYVSSHPFGPHKFFSTIDVLKHQMFDRRLARRVWRVVVCKEEDRGFFGARRDRAFVVPNGTDVRPELPASEVEPNRLLFVGMMSYFPNQDAVRWFVRECLPLVGTGETPPVRLDVVGASPPPDILALNGERVAVHGFVESVEEWYHRATVVVAPVRLGGGTRLKVLEALSYGKAVVATSEVVSGLNLRPGVDVEVADRPAEFAAACGRLLQDPVRRASLGHTGRARVLAQFTWPQVGDAARRVLSP